MFLSLEPGKSVSQVAKLPSRRNLRAGPIRLGGATSVTYWLRRYIIDVCAC